MVHYQAYSSVQVIGENAQLLRLLSSTLSAPMYATFYPSLQVENILQSLADMPKAEPVLTMGELRARRLRRGLKWAHMQRERQ